MTGAFAGDLCGCGAFKYAGHRCTYRPAPASEADRLRSRQATAKRAFDLVRQWPQAERAMTATLIAAEQDRITARLAELEGGSDE